MPLNNVMPSPGTTHDEDKYLDLSFRLLKAMRSGDFVLGHEVVLQLKAMEGGASFPTVLAFDALIREQMQLTEKRRCEGQDSQSEEDDSDQDDSDQDDSSSDEEESSLSDDDQSASLDSFPHNNGGSSPLLNEKPSLLPYNPHVSASVTDVYRNTATYRSDTNTTNAPTTHIRTVLDDRSLDDEVDKVLNGIESEISRQVSQLQAPQEKQDTVQTPTAVMLVNQFLRDEEIAKQLQNQFDTERAVAEACEEIRIEDEFEEATKSVDEARAAKLHRRPAE